MNISRKQSYGEILSNIHWQLFNKYKIKGEKDEEAKAIESALRELKKQARLYQRALNPNTVLSAEENKAEQFIMGGVYQNFLDEVARTLRTNGHSSGLTAHQLFHRSHESFNYNNKNYHDIFEEELAAVIASLEKASGSTENRKILINKALFGKTQANTQVTEQYLSGTLPEGVQSQVSKIIEEVGKRYGKAAENVHSKIQKGSVKIDVTAERADITYSKLNDELKPLAALAGHTFTVKNYKSFYRINNPATKSKWFKSNDQIRLRLSEDSSNLFKAVTGSLSEIGVSYKMNLHVFFRGMNHLKGNHTATDWSSATEQHFTHLRKIYELRGCGLLDNTGTARAADFIIWNDPDSDNIAVRSTDSIIYDWFQGWISGTAENLFKEIRLSGSSFDWSV